MKRTIYKRKKNGKTNYKKRLKLLLSKKPRLVIRKSLNGISLQIIQYFEDGDKVIISAKSSDLKKLGWNLNEGNIPAAYLTGLLVGKRAQEKKVGEIIADIGLNTPTKGGKIFAALKGAVDSGLKIPHSKEMFPDEETISGKKIQTYLDLLKDKKTTQFGKYKKGIIIIKEFEKVKNAIEK